MPIIALGGPVAVGGGEGNVDAMADGRLVVVAGPNLNTIDAGGEVTFLTGLEGNIANGQVDTLADGRYIVNGTEHAGLGAGNIYRIYNADGTPASDILRLSELDGTRGSGHVEALANGGWFFSYDDTNNGSNALTWADGQGNVGRESDVTWRTFTAAGAGSSPAVAWTGTESVSGATTDRTSGEQSSADSVQLTGGQIAFAYRDERFYGTFNTQGQAGGYSRNYTVSVQVRGADGFSHPIQVNTDPFDTVPYQPGDTNYAVGPDAMNSIVALPNGGFAVIWHERRYAADASFTGWDTQIRYFNSDGSSRTGEITIAHRDAAYGNLSLTVRAEVLPDGRIVFAFTDGVYGVNGNGSLMAFMGVLAVNGEVSEVTQISPTAHNSDFFSVYDLAVRSDGTVDVAYYNDRPQYVDGVLQPGTQQLVIQHFGLSGLGYNPVGGDAGNNTLGGTAAIDLMVGGEGNDAMTGLASNDRLYGGAGNDVMNGGTGADRMEGGSGDDTYVVDNAADAVVERAGMGIDTVSSSITFNAATAETIGIENVTLVGSGAANALGNDLNNVLTGNSANNGLNGGRGADTMSGGAGDDTYTVDSTGDVVIELANQGVDYVRSNISYTLGSNVENLALQGLAAINGLGNALVNVIVGNAGANIISGKGGADNLTGGAGADTFDYNVITESSYSAYDRITDLTNSDKIDLSGIDANAGVAGNQAFAKVNAFTHHAGEITLTYDAAKDFTVLSADVNGDGVADMRIVLNGDHHTFTNFIF